jgi:TolB protein
VNLEGDFLALLPDSSTAWRPWEFEVPDGDDLEFCFEVSWSRTVVAYHIGADSVHGKAQICMSDPAASRCAQLTHDDSDNTSPQVSPDGTKILFVSTRSSFLRQPQFWTLNVDGTGLYRVIFNFTVNEFPRWSPEGTHIVYQRLVADKWHIYLMDADGRNQINLSDEIAGDFYPAFSADGTKIIFRSNRQGPGLYIMNRDGSNKRKWLDYAVYDAVWSPDGHRLAFQAGLEDLYVFDIEGGSLRNLTPQTEGIVYRYPAWSPDGYRILVECQTLDGSADIFRINRDGTDLVELIHSDSVTCHRPNWGPSF